MSLAPSSRNALSHLLKFSGLIDTLGASNSLCWSGRINSQESGVMEQKDKCHFVNPPSIRTTSSASICGLSAVKLWFYNPGCVSNPRFGLVTSLFSIWAHRFLLNFHLICYQLTSDFSLESSWLWHCSQFILSPPSPHQSRKLLVSWLKSPVCITKPDPSHQPTSRPSSFLL